MKVISFCLWGNLPYYDIGALKNIELAKQYYPDWICYFYVPERYHLIKQLNNTNTKIIELSDNLPACLKMMWRFLPIFDTDVDITISRDCDARLTLREAKCVQEFEKSDYKFQAIRDHQCHISDITPIMGGTWGCKGTPYDNFRQDYNEFITNGYKLTYPESNCYPSHGIRENFGADQIFLRHVVLPNVKDFLIDNCDININGNQNPIGELKDKSMFIGNKFDENDIPEFIRGY